MFFKGGERLIIQGKNLHTDYQRYNEITRGLFTSKVGEIAVDNVFRKNERAANSKAKSVELSLWRVTDRNINAWERGIDRSQFVFSKPNGERVSYVLVPRMNTDAKDTHPCEYTEAKDATFEDVNDPRAVVIARSYKGVVAELAKDFVIKNESVIRTKYKFLTDDTQDAYCDFANSLFLKTVTEQAIKMFEPNVYQSFQNANKNARYAGQFNYVDPVNQIMGLSKIQSLFPMIESRIDSKVSDEADCAYLEPFNAELAVEPAVELAEAEGVEPVIPMQDPIYDINAIREPKEYVPIMKDPTVLSPETFTDLVQ